jgi:Yippee zinc-binding/DNA-binding /Mis18, centromere assembly
VRDISCRGCNLPLGWKYCSAKEASQQYKTGKFLIEAVNTVKMAHFVDDGWDSRSVDLDTLDGEEERGTEGGNVWVDDVDELMVRMPG